MAQADSVPTPIPEPITGAPSNASTDRRAEWRRVATDHNAISLSRSKTARKQQSSHPSEGLRWYQAVTGRMPVSLYVVAVCFATAVILLSPYPWNALLILLLFSSSKHLKLSAIDNANEDDGLWSSGGDR